MHSRALRTQNAAKRTFWTSACLRELFHRRRMRSRNCRKHNATRTTVRMLRLTTSVMHNMSCARRQCLSASERSCSVLRCYHTTKVTRGVYKANGWKTREYSNTITWSFLTRFSTLSLLPDVKYANRQASNCPILKDQVLNAQDHQRAYPALRIISLRCAFFLHES